MRVKHHLLRPAWFDEARLIVQGKVFERMLEAQRISGRVLNAGCGEGLYAPLLETLPEVTDIVNVDLSAPAVARSRTDERHRDVRASVTALPFVEGTFDAVICSEVLEHIPDDASAVGQIARVLKRGGLLLASVPTPPAPFDANHVREGYTRQELRDLLSRHGLEVRADSTCMHLWMRALYVTWQRLHRLAGRNLFPRAVLRAAAHADRRTTWGKPWDLVAIAFKR